MIRLLLLMTALTPDLQAVGGWVNKWIFSDWDFVPFLVVAIVLDTFTGVYVNAVLGKIHSFKMRSLFEKLQQYAIGMIIIHGIASHMVDGSPNPVVHVIVPFLKGAFYAYMLVCEAISIEENLQRIGKGYLPVWIKKKLLDYKETGKTDLKPTPEESNEILNEAI